MSPILPKTVHAIALFLIMSENTPIKAVLRIGAAGWGMAGVGGMVQRW